MKKLGIVLLLLFSLSANAQHGRLKGSNTFQVGVGFTDTGLLVNGYFGRKFDQKIRGLVGGSFTTGKVANLNYYGVYVDGMVSYEMYANRNKSYSLNLQGGVTFVFDVLSEFKSSELSKNTSFNTGGVIGLETEYYMTRSLAFILMPNIRYYVKENFGKNRYQISAGIRFLLQ